MTDDALYVLANDAVRKRVLAHVEGAEPGTRVLIRPPAATLPQRDKMWAMLTEIARNFKDPHGNTLTTDEWKVRFLDALGRETHYIAALDRPGFIPYGQSSRALSKSEMSDMIELLYQFGAKNGYTFHTPDSALPRRRHDDGADKRGGRVPSPPPASQGKSNG